MLADLIPKLASLEAEEEWEDTYKPRPSMAGPERCIRSMVYHGLGFPKSPWPGRLILTINDSSWHEELTLDWLRKSAYQIHSEQMHLNIPAGLDFLPERTCMVRIGGDPCGKIIPVGNLSAHIDGIFTDILGVDRLLEHKAINHFTFQKYWDNDELPLDYFTQCAIYTCGAQKVNPALVEGLLLVKNKNTAQYMEYLFYYPSDPEHDILTVINKTNSNGETKNLNIHIPQIVTDACDKFKLVQQYIEAKTLPKRPYDFDHWRCDYCFWGKTCWEGYEKEFKKLKTNEMLPDEVADMVRYYKEVGAHKKESEKEYEELKDKIKKMMKDQDTREGRAGEYVCKLSLSSVARLDKDLLTEAEREKATKTTYQERLNISSPKRKETVNETVSAN